MPDLDGARAWRRVLGAVDEVSKTPHITEEAVQRRRRPDEPAACVISRGTLAEKRNPGGTEAAQRA